MSKSLRDAFLMQLKIHGMELAERIRLTDILLSIPVERENELHMMIEQLKLEKQQWKQTASRYRVERNALSRRLKKILSGLVVEDTRVETQESGEYELTKPYTRPISIDEFIEFKDMAIKSCISSEGRLLKNGKKLRVKK